MAVDLTPISKYFWDQDPGALVWEKHRDFIIRRILQQGDFQSMRWLRMQMGDESLRAWIISHRARGLSPRQIRYWALILDIETTRADEWIRNLAESTWHHRS